MTVTDSVAVIDNIWTVTVIDKIERLPTVQKAVKILQFIIYHRKIAYVTIIIIYLCILLVLYILVTSYGKIYRQKCQN